MRAIVQRVSQAAVHVDQKEISKIGPGLVVLLGLHHLDSAENFPTFTKKLLNLRIFPDIEGKMNLNIQDIQGELLVISQFTVYGDCKKGTRPNFMQAMPYTQAESLFNAYLAALRTTYPNVKTGLFGAKMDVSLTNDGPVTIIIDN